MNSRSFLKSILPGLIGFIYVKFMPEPPYSPGAQKMLYLVLGVVILIVLDSLKGFRAELKELRNQMREIKDLLSANDQQDTSSKD